jgi:hypothetical protein
VYQDEASSIGAVLVTRRTRLSLIVVVSLQRRNDVLKVVVRAAEVVLQLGRHGKLGNQVLPQMPDYHIPKPNSYEGVSLLKF